jgi:hypothetical protein
MDFLATFFAIVFFTILLTVAATFGFALLTFFVSIGVVTALLIYGREIWYRWRFVQRSQPPEHNAPNVIETDYEDISPKE